MKRLGCLFCLLLVCLLGPSMAKAGQQRVLLSFDNSGHTVRQIVFTKDSQGLAPQAYASESDGVVPDLAVLQAELKPGFATLVWLDDQGVQIARMLEPDPRLSHSPSHIDGSNQSRFAEQTGAWLVTGPAEATQLLVLLAETPFLEVPFEMWQMALIEQ